MTVRLDGDVILLEGACRIEDAEPLSALLQASPDRPVDLSACTQMHAAVAQALLAFAPALTGSLNDLILRAFLAPLLNGRAMSTLRGTTVGDDVKEDAPGPDGGPKPSGRS